MAKETAEQKLLKIIETTDAQGAPAASSTSTENVAQQVASSVKGAGFSLPDLLSSLLGIFRGKSSDGSSGFGLRDLNRMLLFATGVLLALFLFDFFNGLKYSKQNFDSSLEIKNAGIPKSFLPNFKQLSDYVANISRRNIFQPFEKKEEPKVVETPEGTRKIVEQAKDLKLVGISWRDTPESASALIENTVTGLTYFLKLGDQVNNVTIKTIFADSVILTFEGEETRLNL